MKEGKIKDKKIFFSLTLLFLLSAFFLIFSISNISAEEKFVEDCAAKAPTSLSCGIFSGMDSGTEIWGLFYKATAPQCVTRSVADKISDCPEGCINSAYVGGSGVHCKSCQRGEVTCPTTPGKEVGCGLNLALPGISNYWELVHGGKGCGSDGNCYDSGYIGGGWPDYKVWTQCAYGCTTWGGAHCKVCANSDTSCGGGSSCENCNVKSPYGRWCTATNDAIRAFSWHCGGDNGCATNAVGNIVEWCQYGCAGPDGGAYCLSGKAAGSSCSANMECINNDCRGNVCGGKPDGASCNGLGSQCASGYCIAWQCGLQNTGESCTFNTDCYNGDCRGDVCGGLPSGSRCTFNVDCSSRSCGHKCGFLCYVYTCN